MALKPEFIGAAAVLLMLILKDLDEPLCWDAVPFCATTVDGAQRFSTYFMRMNSRSFTISLHTDVSVRVVMRFVMESAHTFQWAEGSHC